MKKIEQYTRRSHLGLSLLNDQWIEWVLTHQSTPRANNENGWGFGQVTSFSWVVGNQRLEKAVEELPNALVLPDASGFIAFENRWEPDNCLLLDVYGLEKMRLSIPWELTKEQDPVSGRAPSSFSNVSRAYKNSSTGALGKFGVSAWVEHAGRYYFELDYHAGRFLWGVEIGD